MSNTLCMSLVGQLTYESIQSACSKLIDAQMSQKVEKVVIYICSNGGYLRTSMGLFDLIKQFPKPTESIAIGKCSSSALTIAQACDSRVCYPDTEFVIHKSKNPMSQKMTAEDMFHEYQDSIELDKRFMELTHYKSKHKNVLELHNVETLKLDPNMALEYGFVDEIIQLPETATKEIKSYKKTKYISINREIDELALTEIINDLHTIKNCSEYDHVYIILNCSLGNTDHAVALYYLLKSIAQTVTIFTFGHSSEDVLLVQQAANIRLVLRNAIYFIYQLEYSIKNSTSLSEVTKEVEDMQDWQKLVDDILFGRCNKKDTYIEKVKKDSEIMLAAEECVEAGFIDKVVDTPPIWKNMH